MRKIRIGKDIVLKWALFDTEENPFDLSGRDLTLMLVTPLMTKHRLDFQVTENVIETKLKGIDQRIIGVYTLTLWLNYGKDGQNVVDYCKAFELVPLTCMEGGEADNTLQVETIDIQSIFDVGVDGLSAYEIALKNGFEGTEEEWLASLKGEAFRYEDFTPEQIKALQKPAIDAATEIGKTNTAIIEAEQKRNEAETTRQQTFTLLSEQMTQAINSIPVSMEDLGEIND